MKTFIQSGGARKCCPACTRVQSVCFHRSWHKATLISWVRWVKIPKRGHPRNTQSTSTLAHILVTSVVLLLVSAVLHLAFALALYVLLIHNMSVPSKRKIATTKNQSTDTRRCALNPVGLWPSAWNINLSQNYLQHSIHSSVLLLCILSPRRLFCFHLRQRWIWFL